jgi:hypothetical protein
MKAHGQLRHHFHGEYSATIAVQFESAEHADQALSKLGDGWKVGDKASNALIWFGNSEALKKCKEILVGYGADEKKIDSCAKSIDYGEPFDIDVPAGIPKEQASLF